MFGRDWEPATAKIVAKRFKESGDRSGVWEYVADVTSRSGSVFRTTLKQPPFMSHVVWLQEGEVVGVLADVTHEKAKFDRSDPRVSGKGRRSESGEGSADAFDQALAAPPGSPAPGGAHTGADQPSGAPAFDRGAWIALVQEGEEAAENATDPKLASEISDLVDRFDGGRVTEAEYKARLAELTEPPDSAA
ncbi:MAG TPA: hypothetical protein VMU39_26700 [Solirubrobacteraceae bacterium]|nr:hypothetical protein [Solirubrobacteraceae bacterium]